MNVKLIKYPSAEDWMFCKRCTLVTVGKEAVKEPTQEWKHKISNFQPYGFSLSYNLCAFRLLSMW